MLSYDFVVTDSLNKVFFDQRPKEKKVTVEAFFNETVSFQVAYYSDYSGKDLAEDTLHFTVKSATGITLSCRKVVSVPTTVVCSGACDSHYITTKPGLFPDLLEPMQEDGINLIQKAWRSMWFDVAVDTHCTKTQCTIEVQAISKNEKGEKNIVWKGFVPLKIHPLTLPKQSLIHTEMFHADCLADYYGLEVFSKKHWEIVENFIKTATSHGINMIFTPLFTPPMDTAVGGERTTVQLVDVKKEKGAYQFGFKNLDKWIEICVQNSVEYIEMAPLFTQWGAEFAPKIMAEVNGKTEMIFGWHTRVSDGDYLVFLGEFLPELTAFLKEKGVFDKVWFHVSDEPREGNMEHYRTAQECMAKYLPNSPLFDACSDYALYSKGAVKKPVVSNDHIQPYIQAAVPNLWTYYCCVQGVDVSNRFFAMPSYRNRILAVQLYLYNIEGFLHWGYNFYNSRFSKKHINPFAVTDCAESFPGGDAFLVYPAEDGTAMASIRLMVLYHAMQDLRSMQLLETLTSRAYVETLIMDESKMEITFSKYPHNDAFIFGLRERINEEIMQHLK